MATEGEARNRRTPYPSESIQKLATRSFWVLLACAMAMGRVAHASAASARARGPPPSSAATIAEPITLATNASHCTRLARRSPPARR